MGAYLGILICKSCSDVGENALNIDEQYKAQNKKK